LAAANNLPAIAHLEMTGGGSGYRAVDTMAILPPAPQRAAYRRQPADSGESAHETPTATASLAAPNTPALQLLKAETAEARTAAEPEPREWIVLTSWQEAQAPAVKTGLVADYDTEKQDEAGDAVNHEPAGRFAVTRLILRVYPASATAANQDSPQSSPASPSTTPAAGITTQPASRPTEGANTGASSSSKSLNQPAAVPFGDGWLVIQL
jgi:hypothetical protein